MCGIVGYIGSRDAVPMLIEGLSRLEYRGYDSAGVAILKDGAIRAQKRVGRLKNLDDALQETPLPGAPGIGHTRWATHGQPTEINSHPHLSGDESVAVVHNGIIENYQELRAELEAKGHKFLSQTDTETIPHLIEDELQNGAKDIKEAICNALKRARGAYALGIIYKDDPDTLYCARHGSPLIIGLGKNEQFIASDVPAIINQIDNVIYLNDGEVGALTADGVKVYDLDGKEVEAVIKDIDIDAESAEMGDYETFMQKEIYEQPSVLQKLLAEHITPENKLVLDEIGQLDDYFKGLKRIMIISCGTAYYAGCYGRLIIENLTNIHVETDVASEFRYRNPKIEPDTLVIPVTQSGETADTLASIRMCKEVGCKVVSICNVPGSSIVRESDGTLLTKAGPEIGVASTKAYTAQQMCFALLALHMAQVRGEITPEREDALIGELKKIPALITETLSRKDECKRIAEKHHKSFNSLYLGRKFNYPTAMEGALKNKEISYQHSEAYASGEMKHGPIALINKDLPVVCIASQTEDEVYEKVISNMKEVQARSGQIVAIATDGDEAIKEMTEDIIYVPATQDQFSPLVNVIPMQFIAYYMAQARGCDIDKPRNLAKSVTVE